MSLINVINIAKQKGVSPEDFIDEIWETEATTLDKVIMSLDLYDIQPTYHVLTTMWFNYYSTSAVTMPTTDIILKKYFDELSSPRDLAESMEYSFYFDIFEDPDRNEYAWQYFLNQKPTDHFFRIMLRNSGPVPYHLKETLYSSLISDKNLHVEIFRSIRHSCFDNCGLVDKTQALLILKQLDRNGEMDQIKSEVGFQDFEAVLQHLNKNGS
jgi:hypothetical protein